MEILNKVTSTVKFEGKGLVVSYVNVYNYAILRKYPELISEIDSFTFDGVLLKQVFRLLTGKNHKRMSPDFGSYFEDLFQYMDKNKESLYVIGATQEDIKIFSEVIAENFKSVEIIGARDGYFNKEEEQSLLEGIERTNPNKILIGMGTPKQEFLAMEIKRLGTGAAIFPCGAFIAQTSKRGKTYYPDFFNRLNLRWLYRILNEPSLLKRYLIEYPISLCIFTFDFIKNKTSHKANDP